MPRIRHAAYALFTATLAISTARCAIQAPAAPISSDQIGAVIEKAADVQLEEIAHAPPPQPAGGGGRFGRGPAEPVGPDITWVAGTFYAGLAELSHASAKGEDYTKALTALGQKVNWTPRVTRRNFFWADDFCIGQAFLDVYATSHDPAVFAPFKLRLDNLVTQLNQEPAATSPRGGPNLTWWWCDALFMCPEVLTRASVITGDPKYINAMDKEWWRTTALLYDPQEHLFFRDASFLNKKSKHGQKMFWARGNGWVMGALPPVLQYMPQDFPSRPKYVAMFKEMAAKLASLQGPDGLWRASLLDADEFPNPEASGTALNCYGLAWGINNGLLDRATYLPVAAKAWAGLLAARRPDGLVGYTQRPGDQPGYTAPTDSQYYTTGAFILAGLQLQKLSPFDMPAPPTLRAPQGPPSRRPATQPAMQPETEPAQATAQPGTRPG